MTLEIMEQIKLGGILCGHDLEGHSLHKFNTFPQEYMTVDFVESCHPGVIQAVGELIGFDKITEYPSYVWGVKINSKREFEKI